MADSRFTTIFGITGAGEDTNIVRIAVEAVRQGYAVIPLPPGRKTPMCTLTARETKLADDAATGRKHDCGVHHAITDDALARKVFTRLQKDAGEQPLNIGIVAYPSRIIVVDADTAAAVQAFVRYLAEQQGDDAYLAHTPTVLTPGAMNDDGTWKHKDGGHFYFRLPDGVDIDLVNGGVIPFDGGFQIRWGWSMTVAPPSVRAEGPYVAQGNVPEAPEWMLSLIGKHNQQAAERKALRGSWHTNEPIAAWSCSVSWADLLVPDGWSDTSKVDTCGCPIFEKPGGGSTTYKSATGHEAECEKWENLEGHGPLHLWTTEPPAPLDEYVAARGQTITKLAYVALTQYDDDIALAKIELGIDHDADLADWVTAVTSGDGEVVTPVTNGQVTAVTSGDGEVVTRVTDAESFLGSPKGDGGDDSANHRGVDAVTIPYEGAKSLVSATLESDGEIVAVTDGDGTVTEDEAPDPVAFIDAAMERFHHPATRAKNVRSAFAKGLDEVVSRSAVDEYVRAMSGSSAASILEEMMGFATEEFDTTVVASPTILERTDGQCLYHRGRVNFLVGKRGSGKTWMAMLATAQVLEAGGKVVYFDFEDRRELFYERMAALGVDLETPRREGRFVYVKQFPTNVVDLPDFTEFVGQFDLVVFDVINRMISRLGGNPDVGNEEAIWLTDNLFDPLAGAGAGVLVLDHPNKKGQSRDAEVEDLNPGGGAMKMNNASGVVVAMRNITPFTRERPDGHIRLYCLKDRTGYFAENELCGELKSRADILADGSLGRLLYIDPPDADGSHEPTVQDDVNATKEKVLALLKGLGAMTEGSITKKITQRLRPLVDVALGQLVSEGLVTKAAGTKAKSDLFSAV